jgi:hypothetical protein
MPNLTSAVRQLETFVTNLEFDTTPPRSFGSEPLIMLSDGEATTVYIRGQDSEALIECVQTIFDSVSEKEIISRDSVDRLVSDLILHVARVKREKPSDFQAQLNDELRGLTNSLNSQPTEWELYIPVFWLAVSELPFQVGQVRLYQGDASGTQEYWQRVVELNPTYDGTPPDHFRLAHLDSQFGDKNIACIRVSALDLASAQSLALKKVRRTLDCINFFSNKQMGTALHVRGDVEQGRQVEAAIQHSQVATPHWRARSTGPRRAMPIKQISARRGFGRVSDLLAKENPNDLEDRILRAVQWAGRARVEPHAEKSFLLFAVALETLLLKDSKTELIYRLTLRAAHLLSSLDLDSRKMAVAQIKKLYDTRSKIVHAGKFDVTDSELNLIDLYTTVALSTVLDREPFRGMTTEKEFEDWFEVHLFGLSQNI